MVDNTKLLLNLDAITKQLQKISATIGISVGISDKGGKPKLKSTLDSSEKFRTRAIAKETAEEYKKILGLGFKKSDAENNVKIFDEKLKITSFFKNSESVFKKISKSVDNLVTVTTNTSTKSIKSLTASNQTLSTIVSRIKDYTSNFLSLERKINNTDKIDYAPNLKEIQSTLLNISTNVPKDYATNFKEIESSLSLLSNNTKNDYSSNFEELKNILSILSSSSPKDYIPNLKEIQSTLFAISTNVPKDYTTNLQAIESSLSSVASNVPKDYTTNLQAIQSSLSSIASNVPKDYEPYYQAIQSSLLTVSTNVPKDYEPIFTETNSKLESIKKGIMDLFSSIPRGKDLGRGWDLLLRRMKWESFRTIVTDYFVRAEASALEVSQKLSDLVQVNTDILNKKPKSNESGMSLGKIAGLMALGVGLVLIINALVKSNMIDTGNLLKVLAVVGAIVAMFIFVGKVGGGIKSAGIGFGILAATILFLIIPMIIRLTQIDSKTLIEGLLKLGVVFATCIGVLYLMGKIKSSHVMKNTKGFGLFALIVGFLVIPLIKHITTIPFKLLLEGLGKLSLVFGACLLAMKGAEKIKAVDVLKSMAGVIALSLVLKYLVIPMLISVSSLDWTVLLKGLANVGLSIIGMGAIAYAIGQLAKSGAAYMLMGAATILALSFVIGYLGDSLTKIAGKDWGDIYKGLGLATLAIVAFGLAVAGIGALVGNPIVAAVLGIGAITIIGLSFVAGYLATSLAKFAGHNWDEITNGITKSVQAMWVFGKTVAKMGLLAAIAAPFMAIGGVVLMKLANVSGSLATNLHQFAGKPWNEIVTGLKGASEGMWEFSKTVSGMGAIVKIFGESIMNKGSVVLYDLSILAGAIANNLIEFAGKPWNEIVPGLKGASEGMWEFSKTVAKMGAIVKIFGESIMNKGSVVLYDVSVLAGAIANNLMEFAGKPWNEIVPGLKGATEGMWEFSKTVAKMGAIVKIFGESLINKGSTLLYDVSVLAGAIANNLMEFANKPWDSIMQGLQSATVAMAKFGVFVAGVSVFFNLVRMGVNVVHKVSNLIGNIAENLFKYSGLEKINFQQIGSGLVFLGQGLSAMFTGSLSNIGSSMLDSISGFFKIDPVSKIKKFETIDAHKIYELGLGLKYMGDGLRSLTTDLNLTKFIRDITIMSKPVMDLAYGVSQFSDAYKKFQAVQMETDLNQIKNINVQNDNGIKDAINESSKLQLDIMKDQLVELRRNNQLMEMLITNGGNSGSPSLQNANMIMPIASNNSKESFTSPNFSTKSHYKDNLKLLSMSFQG